MNLWQIEFRGITINYSHALIFNDGYLLFCCVVCFSGGQDSSAEVEHRSHVTAVLQVAGVGGLFHILTHSGVVGTRSL